MEHSVKMANIVSNGEMLKEIRNMKLTNGLFAIKIKKMLDPIIKEYEYYEEERQEKIKELGTADESGRIEIKPNTPEYEELGKYLGELQNSTVTITNSFDSPLDGKEYCKLLKETMILGKLITLCELKVIEFKSDDEEVVEASEDTETVSRQKIEIVLSTPNGLGKLVQIKIDDPEVLSDVMVRIMEKIDYRLETITLQNEIVKELGTEGEEEGSYTLSEEDEKFPEFKERMEIIMKENVKTIIKPIEDLKFVESVSEISADDLTPFYDLGIIKE